MSSNYTICTLWPCLDEPDPIWTQISSSVFCGLGFGFLIAADVYARVRNHVTRQLQEVPDWDEDTVFAEQYFDELEALDYWTDDEVKAEADNWRKFWLTEETPRGTVVIAYDHNLETFLYFTDEKDKMPFNVLDAVARKYAVLSECPNICVNAQLELQAAQEKYLETLKAKADAQKAAADAALHENEKTERPVFAKLKKYNKTQGKSSTSTNVQQDVVYIVRDRSNRFKWLGKIAEFQTQQLKKQNVTETITESKLSYADFLKAQQSTSM